MPDNMEEGVKTLILELPDIVKKNTRNEYPEVKDALIYLEQYVKGKNATRYGALQRLTELEGLLSTKKQEKSPNIVQHITKIRRYWGVGLGENTRTKRSSGNNEKLKKVDQSPEGNMGEEKILQQLGEEFCTAVRTNTQSKYTDIQERLDILMKFIRNKKDVTYITTELDRIEIDLKEKNEFNPTIRECAQKIREFLGVSKGQETGKADKGKYDPKKQRSSESDADLRLSGNDIDQTQVTGNSDVVDNVTNFFEHLVWALHDLLKNNIKDASKAKLPSVPAVSDKELEKKLKDMHAKVEETTKLCIDKNREINQASEFLSQLYKKATHVDQDHVTDQVKKKVAMPPIRLQGNSPVPAKQESGEMSNMNEKFERILLTWKKMEETKELSEIAGSKAIHEDASIAELSDPNRPTKLGEKYLELYDFQWTDAYRNLSTNHPSYSDEKIIGSLHDMLIDSYRFCQGVRHTQKLSLEEILLYPAGGMESISRRQIENIHKILSRHLSEAAKVSSEVTRVNMVKAFVTNEQTKKKYGQIMKLCETFIDGCVQLCWQMQVQTPPVFLDLKTIKGQAFVSEHYREYTRKGNKIAFVVWPALFLHENGPLLVKGIAQGE